MADIHLVLMEITVAYSLFLMIFGFLANVISIVVCLRKKMRTVPTFVFYVFLLVSDTISLYFWNLDHYYVHRFGYLIEDTSLELCRIITFFQMFSFQWSAWLLFYCKTGMTIERYLSTLVKRWRSTYFKPIRAILVACLIGIVLFVINITFVILIDKTDRSDSTYNITCYYTPGYTMWMQAQNYLFCFLPFSIMLITNCLLVYRISIRKKLFHFDHDQHNDKSKATLTVVLVTTIFLIFCAPSALVNAFFLDAMFRIDYGVIILFTTDNIVFTFNSFNFFILYFSNKQFAREVKSIFRMCKRCKKNRVHFDPTTHTDTRTRVYDIEATVRTKSKKLQTT